MKEEEREYDKEILRDICNNRDRELIKKNSHTYGISDDSWYWMWEEKGMFIEKICYRRLQGEFINPHCGFWSTREDFELHMTHMPVLSPNEYKPSSKK